jgi:hypothetical protein
MTVVPFLVLRSVPLTTLFSCMYIVGEGLKRPQHRDHPFCNWTILVVGVRVIRGDLPILPGTAFSFEVASVPGASVSISDALRGTKKFRVTTSLRGRFKVVDILSALPLSFQFRWFHRWRASSASVRFGNHPPLLFVALLFLICYFGLLGFSPWTRT